MVSGLQEPKSGFAELAKATKLNQYLAINTIDFTGTKICKMLGSSAASSLGEFLSTHRTPIETLILNDCDVSAKVRIATISANCMARSIVCGVAY
jgi:hypothetical protein